MAKHNKSLPENVFKKVALTYTPDEILQLSQLLNQQHHLPVVYVPISSFIKDLTKFDKMISSPLSLLSSTDTEVKTTFKDLFIAVLKLEKKLQDSPPHYQAIFTAALDYAKHYVEKRAQLFTTNNRISYFWITSDLYEHWQ